MKNKYTHAGRIVQAAYKKADVEDKLSGRGSGRIESAAVVRSVGLTSTGERQRGQRKRVQLDSAY